MTIHADRQPANSTEDFGHEPMDVYTNGKLRTVECARCPVQWPCTSAIVLGLTPRRDTR
ncbi:hypothetical protein AB0D99_32035 [Streptomyces sp. NPDC047971]|uniref:hypothetical protein n=1 Tax=Streptomyces sp. NPDC047971 TaxID=3154499 RepID=UPI0033CFD46B